MRRASTSSPPRTRRRTAVCSSRATAASSRLSARERGPKASDRSPPLSSVAHRLTVSSGKRRANAANASSSSGPKRRRRSFSRRNCTGSSRWTNWRPSASRSKKARICRSDSSSVHRPPVGSGRSDTAEVDPTLLRKKADRRSRSLSDTSVPRSAESRSGTGRTSSGTDASVASSSGSGTRRGYAIGRHHLGHLHRNPAATAHTVHADSPSRPVIFPHDATPPPRYRAHLAVRSSLRGLRN